VLVSESDLYKNNPFNALALEEYVGRKAVCKRLGETIKNGDQITEVIHSDL